MKRFLNILRSKHKRFDWFLWRNNITGGVYSQPVNRYFFAFGDGWIPLVLKLMKELKKEGWNGYILYTKEKFGGLRFDAGFHEIESKYEDLSFETCEVCGKPGRQRDRGESIGKRIWLKTVCDKHFEEWKI